MNRSLFAAAALGASLAAASAAHAVSVTVELDYEYTDGGTPSSLPMTVKVEQTVPDVLVFTLGMGGLTTSEHLKDFFFNLDPFYSSPPLSYSSSDSSAGPVAFSASNDSLGAGGGTKFDYQLSFPNSNSDNRLTGGEEFVFSLSASGLKIADLVSKSTDKGAVKDYDGIYFAAHIGGIGDNANLSGWMTCVDWEQAGSCEGGPTPRNTPTPPTVPVPASLPLLAGALAGLGLYRRKKSRA